MKFNIDDGLIFDATNYWNTRVQDCFAEESAELIYAMRYQGRQEVKLEMRDVLICLSMLCKHYAINPKEISRMANEKLKEVREV